MPRVRFSRQSTVMNVVRVASGNFLEMYDFIVFGYYAAAIGRTFFPSDNPFASLMSSLMTFGAGFLMRPIGALVLGAYIDRHGRRAGLVFTLALMSLGTLLIAVLPGYAVLGLAAPGLVLLSRLVQGFSAGVELGGVSVYLAEIATPGRKGFYVSWQSASQQVAVMFTALLGVGLNVWLSAPTMLFWGWRIPFAVGCLIIPALFYLRRNLPETDAFLARADRPTPGEVLRLLGRHWAVVTGGLMLVTMTTVSFYLITAYTPTFGTNELHLPAAQSLAVTLCVGLSNFVWLPVMGALSDRVGRKPLLVSSAGLALMAAYPAMWWLVSAPSFGRLLTVELFLSFIFGSYNGAMCVFLTEIMPESVRTTGFSLAYSLAAALFGGFTPAICTYLIHLTGNRAAPGAWLACAAALALVPAIRMKPGVAEAAPAGLQTAPARK